MICEPCEGTGWIKRRRIHPLPVFEEPDTDPPVFVEVLTVPVICRDCGGTGWVDREPPA